MAITQTISEFSVIPNRDEDTPIEFSNNVDTFLSEINTHVDQVNTWSGQANSVASEVNANAADAKTYRDEAQASQNATAYNDATTYNFPDTVIGSNGHAYRCIVDGTQGDNPVGSSTGHWAQITVGSTEIFEDQVKSMQFRAFGYTLMF